MKKPIQIFFELLVVFIHTEGLERFNFLFFIFIRDGNFGHFSGLREIFYGPQTILKKLLLPLSRV